ncbi:hypothetical protein [Treponema pedis]|uniref:hypothetical protein n=1 Tax=Treponema pedis TaxID=409322 RepID=UPI000400FE7F|nr:hypothetical protein [Treponema pedis]
MKTIKLLFLLTSLAVITSAGCASMYIHGSNPVQRAVSAAELIIDGNVSDDYIKVYKTETAKAEASMTAMLDKAEQNNIYYADIADNISDWILLYQRILTLQKMYPEGLKGKNEFTVFEAKDYSGLKDKAYTKATEALYSEALRLVKSSANDSQKIEKVLTYLKRAKKYSHHLDNEINSLGAEVTYNAAEALFYTNKPESLLKSYKYYMLADSWISDYKGSLGKARNAEQKAARLYIDEGNYNMSLKDYAAFRRAKLSYQKAENIIRGIAARELDEVNKKLTVRLAIVIKENGYYNEESKIAYAVKSELASSNSGPEIIEINFIKRNGNYILDFIDIRNADLVFAPADNYGKVKEIYGPVNISRTAVSKTVNGILYTGEITEQSQTVTVYAQNDFILYDVRSWRKTEQRYFTNETNKLTKNFTLRQYAGAPQAKPDNFDPGFLYIAGQYNRFFPELMQADNFSQLLTNYGSLTPLGKELCNAVKNLQYSDKPDR